MMRRLWIASLFVLAGCKESSSSTTAPSASSSAASAPAVALKKAKSAASLAGIDVRGLSLMGASVVVAGIRDGVVVERVDDAAVSEMGAFPAKKPIVSGLGADGDGLLVGGAFEESLSAGTTKLSAAGAVDGFLVRVGANGKVAWAKDLRAPKPKAPADVGALAVGKDGSAFVEGSSLAAAIPTEDPERGTGLEAIYRVDRDGKPRWKKRYDGDVNVRSLAVDAGDIAWAAGVFGGDMSFGGEKAKSQRVRSSDKLGTTFGTDFFVARVDGSGKTTALRSFGSTTSRAITIALAADGKGGAAIAGEHEGVVDFGEGPVGAAGATRLFVVKLDAGGKTTFARSLEIPRAAHLAGVAADSSGGVVVTGDFTGDLDVGGTKLTSAGGSDCFLARYDASGKVVDAFRFGGTGDDKGGLVALKDTGDAVVTGVLAGRVDLGTGELGKPGDLSAFVATFSK